MWYVLDVAPGGVLYAGLRSGVSADEFRSIADRAEVVEALQRWEVRPGDCMLVRGGTVHAIGGGVTLLEVQQNSDTTYRLYDWGRVGLDGKPRETHVDLALACVRFGEDDTGPRRADWRTADGVAQAELVRTDSFAMDVLRLDGGARFDTGGALRILAVVKGHGRLTVRGEDAACALKKGEVWLLPACVGGYEIAPQAGVLELVRLS